MKVHSLLFSAILTSATSAFLLPKESALSVDDENEQRILGGKGQQRQKIKVFQVHFIWKGASQKKLCRCKRNWKHNFTFFNLLVIARLYSFRARASTVTMTRLFLLETYVLKASQKDQA